LETRAIAYERTAALLKGDPDPELHTEPDEQLFPKDALDTFFIPEECKDAYDAEQIAEHFRDIIASLNKQTEQPA
jgi:hypothetical protein